MAKEHVPDEWLDEIVGWASSHVLIKRVWLFGSRVKGTATEDSDLDIAYELDMEQPDQARAWNSDHKNELGRPDLAVKLHLNHYHPDDASIVKVSKAVNQHGILVYEKGRDDE